MCAVLLMIRAKLAHLHSDSNKFRQFRVTEAVSYQGFVQAIQSHGAADSMKQFQAEIKFHSNKCVPAKR